MIEADSMSIAPATFPGRAAWRGSPVGWGISLLAHALIIGWLWHATLSRPARIDATHAQPMAVWLVPAAALPLPPKVRPAPAVRADAASTRAIPDPDHALRRPLSRTAPAPLAAPQAPVFRATLPALAAQSEPAIVAGGNAPAFDMAAARSTARAVTREDRKGTGALALRGEEMAAKSTERFQQRLEGAHRSKCLKGNESTNLLANVAMLAKDMVANAVDDSGCKW